MEGGMGCTDGALCLQRAQETQKGGGRRGGQETRKGWWEEGGGGVSGGRKEEGGDILPIFFTKIFLEFRFSSSC